MAITLNGTELTTITYDGTEVFKVNYDGVNVYHKLRTQTETIEETEIVATSTSGTTTTHTFTLSEEPTEIVDIEVSLICARYFRSKYRKAKPNSSTTISEPQLVGNKIIYNVNWSGYDEIASYDTVAEIPAPYSSLTVTYKY